jgi:chromosome segregation ATPase
VKSNRDDLDKSTLERIERKLHEKLIVVQTLRNLILTMNSDIITRENEVFERELRAQEKQKLLDAANREEEELMERIRVAEEAKRTLFASIQRIEQTNERLLKEKVEIQGQLEVALNEKARLALLSADLTEREDGLERKVQELLTKKRSLEQLRMNGFEEEVRAALGISAARHLVTEEEEEEEEVVKDESDLIVMEYEIEREERVLSERIRELEIRRQKGAAFWAAKLESLEVMIESLSQQVSSMASLEEVQKQIRSQREANQRIEREIQVKEQELRELKEQLQLPDVLYQQTRDAEAEWKRVAQLEQQLRDELESLESDEKTVQAEEEQMKQTRQDIEEQKQQIQATNAANRMLMDTIRAQLKTAQDQLGPPKRPSVQFVDTD